jgi:GH24 family phage-related lysozyme (muramidase)
VRQVSTRGLALIREFEGCKLHAYKCPAGVWTIGFGATRIAGKPVKPTLTISHAEALILLQHQVAEHWNEAEKRILHADELAQEQVDALASFVFNVGVRAFGASTLLKLLNQGQDVKAADEFQKWNKAGGKVSRGLVRRRQAERQLFLRGLQ